MRCTSIHLCTCAECSSSLVALRIKRVGYIIEILRANRFIGYEYPQCAQRADARIFHVSHADILDLESGRCVEKIVPCNVISLCRCILKNACQRCARSLFHLDHLILPVDRSLNVGHHVFSSHKPIITIKHHSRHPHLPQY